MNTQLTLKFRILVFASLIMSLTSCIDGYNDEWTYSPGVVNTQLESPDASGITITTQVNRQGNEEFKIKWPVVYGAGGYSFTLYNIDDPQNPVAVGQENQTVDGCSVIRPQQEDTKYRIVIKTLGNTKYNNKEAETATQVDFTNLVPTVARIPNNSELSSWFAQWIAQNPDSISNLKERAFELEPNGNYTLDGNLDFGLNWITFRGDKIYRPKITYGVNGRLITQSGLKIKFIDFDLSNIPSTEANGALLLLSANPNPSIVRAAYSSFPALIDKDILIKSCNIMGINKYLFYTNASSKNYTVKSFRIQDCIIASNSTTNVIALPQGYVNDLSLIQNTIYSRVNSSTQFITYQNAGRPDRGGYLSGSISLYNNTLYNLSYSGNFANYPGMSNISVTVRLKQNLFVDCSSKNVARRLCPNGNLTCPREFNDNAYWWNPDGFTEADEMGGSSGDKSGSGFYENPSFVGPINDANPANVNFTPIGATIRSKKVGDPRWLTVQ